MLSLPLKLNLILQEYAITWDFQEKTVSSFSSGFFTLKRKKEKRKKDNSEKNEY